MATIAIADEQTHVLAKGPINIRLSDIKLHHTIAVGGQGTEILAEYQDKLVVIKKLNWASIPTEVERALFEAELKVWREVTHEKCISLLGTIDEGTILGFVVEYCHQGSLNHKFCSGVSINGIQSIVIAKTIAEALLSLHAQNIVHRDIKCSSILLDEYLDAKLGNYGHARKVNDDGLCSTSAFGSLTHLAPEYMEGKEYVNGFRADVYSFGILMHELALSIELQVRYPEQGVDKPSCLSEELREKWWNIAQQCSQRAPEARPSMLEVYESLCSLSLPDFECAKHDESLEHDFYISYCAETDADILFRYIIHINENDLIGEYSAKALQQEIEKLNNASGEP